MDGLSVLDSGMDIKKYLAEKGLSQELLCKTESNDILILPTCYSSGEYYYAQESIDFVKFCREVDKDVKVDILDDGDITMRSLHSFDIWMPLMLVAEKVMFPLGVALIVKYIDYKIKGRESEPVSIDVTIQVKDNKREKTIHYKGDAKIFKEEFDKIDINKLK